MCCCFRVYSTEFFLHATKARNSFLPCSRKCQVRFAVRCIERVQTARTIVQTMQMTCSGGAVFRPRPHLAGTQHTTYNVVSQIIMLLKKVMWLEEHSVGGCCPQLMSIQLPTHISNLVTVASTVLYTWDLRCPISRNQVHWFPVYVLPLVYCHCWLDCGLLCFGALMGQL